MKKSLIKFLSVILTCLLILCACSQDPSSADKIKFKSEIDVLLKNSKKTITNTYSSDFFREDAHTFDKNLALLSYALAASTSGENAVQTLNTMRFGNIEQHWNDEEHINGCSYVIGHRKVDDHELVAVYIKGIGYSVEWAGNMTIGESGNHEGFETAAEEVYSALKDYLAAYCPDGNIKLWITGYSRAAALSDVLAVKIISNGEVEVNQKDLFVYAFEPPASVSSDIANNEDYTCIHNIYVESDIVPSIPPDIESADYGLSSPGVNLKMAVTVDGVEDSLHKYVGKDVDMPEFTPGDGYTDPVEFLEYFLEGLTSSTTDPDAASLESRETFYLTIQTRLTYLAEVLMKNNRAGLGALTEFISENKDELALIIFRWIGNDGFYNDLAPILDSCGTEYDATELQNACSIIPSLYKNTDFDLFLLGFVADSSKVTNAMYTVSCHYPEVCYALLNAQAF